MKHSLSVKVLLLLVFAPCLTSCAKHQAVHLDEKKLAQERDRLAAEKAAAREALIRELVARDLPAQTPSDSLWQGFRSAYPYHSQVLALSASNARDQSRTLVISEPPPSVALGDFLVPTKDILLNHRVQQRPVGHDGWTRDLVLAVKGSDDAIASAISSLNQILFATSYKSYVLPLPTVSRREEIAGLDLKVTAAELKNWTVDLGETFIPIEGGPTISMTDLFARPDSSVFFTNTPGMVGWWIPKGKDIQTCRAEIREFALDSDLIVGAVSKPSGILILGRERVVPVDLLPPLRAETISLLAAVQKGQKGQLEQSYERRHLFAGRLDGNKDWAPILLSPELVDTEYGSLLNITDQILKGWSNGGDTEYENFHYPKPGKWPFQNPSLMERLDTDELTYNWNTKGVGYKVKMGEYDVFALHRSGALPVSYIPEGAGDQRSDTVKSAEEQAYNYFASLNDPNLTRVVQYDALYHIFSAFDVAKSSLNVTSNNQPDTVLAKLTGEMTDEVENASSAEKESLVRKLLPLVGRQLAGLPQDELRKGIRTALDHPEPDEPRIAPAFNLNALGIPDDSEEQRWIKNVTLSQLAGIKKFPGRYADEIASNADGWIHTPVVVVSKNVIGNKMGIAIGGHNLYAKVTNFSVSEEAVIGRPIVTEDGTILVNPRDAGRVSELVRTAGLSEGETAEAISSDLQKILASAGEITPRSRSVGLNLPTGSRFGGSPGASERMFGTETLRPPGWGRFRSASSLSEAEIATIRESRALISGSIIISRNSDGAIRLFVDESNGLIEAHTMEDATDVVVQLMRKSASNGPLQLDLRGFNPDEGAAFVKSCEVRAADERIPKEIGALISDTSPQELRFKKFDFTKASVRDFDIEVLPTGEQRATLLVEVPAQDATEVGKTKIELIFEKGTPREIISGIKELVKEAITKVIRQLGDTFDMLTFNRAINLEIKRISRETGIDIKLIRQQFNAERRDLHFVRKDPSIGSFVSEWI
jgi:hypothetical protein